VDCLYCGPRIVDQWRQLVKEAAPTLFLTLTKAGKTVEEAARALTTFLQRLRRGSKGNGPNRVDVHEAYPIGYFVVLERRHSNFEENGFLALANTLYRQFKALLEKAGFPSIHFYDLRRSVVTLLLARGVPPRVVQEILGHSQIGITMDIYSHVLPIMHQEAMGKLNEAFTHGDEEEETNNDDTASGGWC